MEKSSADLSRSWYDPAWIPLLNQTNILDYFMQHSNPFYDRTCNNEVIKMQRLSPEQLQSMTGLEYTLLLHQEPILYVIQKRHRQSPSQTVPLVNYYIIAGVVYQSPDLHAVINSRLLNTVYNLQSAFETARGFQKFNPSRGYSWDFKNTKYKEQTKKNKAKQKEEPSSFFQRERVDLLLVELSKKFPPKHPQQTTQPVVSHIEKSEDAKPEIKVESDSIDKVDDKSKVAAADIVAKPPPDKKLKMAR